MKAKSTAILKLLLLITLCCFHSSAQASTKDGVVEVPFEFYRNEIIVQVKVDGRGLYNMMLDTGTDPSAIDLNTAKELGLKLASVGHQGTGGGTGVNLAFETKLPSLELGGLAASNVEALAIDLSKTSAALGKPIQGILGHSLLNRRVVQIDYPKRVVRFYSKSPFPKTAERPNVSRLTTLPFRYHDNILIEGVSVNGRRMTANFDTGSNANFQLTPDAVRDLGLEAEVSTAQVSKSVGYNGVAENREGKIKSINVGGIIVDEPTVIFFAKGAGRDKKPWGINIGNAFLKDYVVTIDYLSKVITLERP
ncbi:MAG: retroviral-like aspartic protease family protein [Acidobacteriota bacterium]|nr:retroviral-like aspartic protease family protein [Acidobacteriota bacterium]